MPLDLISTLLSFSQNPDALKTYLVGMRHSMDWTRENVIKFITDIALTKNDELFVKVGQWAGPSWTIDYAVLLSVIRCGTVSMVRWLVEDQYAVTTDDAWPVCKAIESRNPDMLRYILKIRSMCFTGRTVRESSPGQLLYDALLTRPGLPMIKFIVEELDADPSVPYTENELSPLQMAAQMNDVEALDYLFSLEYREGIHSQPALLEALSVVAWQGEVESTMWLVGKLRARGTPIWHTRLYLISAIEIFCQTHRSRAENTKRRIRVLFMLLSAAQLNEKQVAFIREKHPCDLWDMYDTLVCVMHGFYGGSLARAETKSAYFDPNMSLLVCEYLTP